jgi:hypothetical protein
MRRTFALSILLLLFAGCSTPAKPEDAEQAATQFFDLLKEANYDRIYKDAARQFREQNVKAAAADKLKEINSLGSAREVTRLSMTIAKEGDQAVVLPVYSVRFDQIRAEITLKLIDEDGTWKLLGFALRPLAAT